MFEKICPIYDFVLLVIDIISNLLPDIISKNIRFL